MAYSIFFKPAAQRQLRKLSRQTQGRLLKRIEQLAEDPYPSGAAEILCGCRGKTHHREHTDPRISPAEAAAKIRRIEEK